MNEVNSSLNTSEYPLSCQANIVVLICGSLKANKKAASVRMGSREERWLGDVLLVRGVSFIS